MYLLKYDDQNPTPHFRCVPTSTDYSKPPTCSVLGTRLQYKMHLLKDGSPPHPTFITICPSLISCFHMHVRLSVTYKGSAWRVWQLDAIYHQL